MSDYRNPDYSWYKHISNERKIPHHCPFASFKKCPKYFASYSISGSSGITAPLHESEDEEILNYWKEFGLLPMAAEIEPCILGIEKKNYRNFCPEVTGTIFGLYSSYIHNYIDDLDLEIAEQQLKNEKASRDDYRWIYSTVMPMHYSDCEHYSILKKSDGNGLRPEDDVFDIKPNYFGFGININAIIRMIIKRIRKYKKET